MAKNRQSAIHPAHIYPQQFPLHSRYKTIYTTHATRSG
jgi:hypothetical protein